MASFVVCLIFEKQPNKTIVKNTNQQSAVTSGKTAVAPNNVKKKNKRTPTTNSIVVTKASLLKFKLGGCNISFFKKKKA